MLRLPCRGAVRALAFSPDNRQLASVAGRDTHVTLWQLGGGRVPSPGRIDDIMSFAFAPDGSALVIASDRYLRRWDLAADTLDQKWRRGANWCWQVAFSPDGSRVAAACFDRYGAADRFRVDVFPVDGAAKKGFLWGDYGTPMCLAFSPGGRFLAAGGDFGRVRVWSVKEKAKAVSWVCAGTVHALAFLRDEARLAVAVGRKVTLYDLATRKPCGELKGHTDYVYSLGTAPDGTLLSAAQDGTARLWDIGSRRERECFDWKLGRLNAAAFSPDGALAAVGGEGEVVVWDVG